MLHPALLGVCERVEIAYYEAGHMMYVHPPSLAAFKRDLAAFIAR